MIDDLVRAAQEARTHAYAPYSGYSVGAAVLAEDGQIYSGCNVENVSFGLTICAERAAVCAMVAGGARRLSAVVVVTRDAGLPCGMCLQTLAEFCTEPGSLQIVSVSESGVLSKRYLADLAPFVFKTDLERNE